ncbi:MAG TPA: hypothetical protein PKH50_01455 [bacterium]|nr:hypothetical protein [bacterium]
MTDYNSNNDKIGGDPNGINRIHRDYYYHPPTSEKPTHTGTEEEKVVNNEPVRENAEDSAEKITSLEQRVETISPEGLTSRQLKEQSTQPVEGIIPENKGTRGPEVPLKAPVGEIPGMQDIEFIDSISEEAQKKEDTFTEGVKTAHEQPTN